MYLVVLYIFIRWKGRVTIIVTITFLRISVKKALKTRTLLLYLRTACLIVKTVNLGLKYRRKL